ncbi:MAG: sugar phosphate isomerase/epimerase family protein [Fimbriimonas sp.]
MRLTVQLYTLRDALSTDLEGTLAKVKEIGLEYVEIAGFYGKSAAEWKTMLDGLGLKVSGSHTGIDLLLSDLDAVIADSKTLENPYIILPWIGGDWIAKGWAELGKVADGIGAKITEAGLTFAYHNHDFEFVTTDGKLGLDEFYENSDPANVKAQLDLAWVSIGGVDPVAYLQQMSGRVPLVHVKDYDPTKTPRWQAAGEGILDFDAILPAAEAAGVQFAGIELDESAEDPILSVRKSFDYFASKGLK